MRQRRRQLSHGVDAARVSQVRLRLPQLLFRPQPIVVLLLHIGEEARVLQRDRGLGRQDLQHGHPLGGEGVGRQIVLEIERADQARVTDYGQTQDRPDSVAMDIAVVPVRIRRRCVFEHHPFARADHVVEHRQR